jgi:hypothetical protein
LKFLYFFSLKEKRAESREQRAESREQRAESREQRAEMAFMWMTRPPGPSIDSDWEIMENKHYPEANNGTNMFIEMNYAVSMAGVKAMNYVDDMRMWTMYASVCTSVYTSIYTSVYPCDFMVMVPYTCLEIEENKHNRVLACNEQKYLVSKPMWI